MKLTKQQLKQLIKEELQNVLQEQAGAGGEEEEFEFEYAPWFSKKGQSRGLPPPRGSGGTRAQSPARYWSWLDQRLDRMEMKILDALYTMGRAPAP